MSLPSLGYIALPPPGQDKPSNSGAGTHTRTSKNTTSNLKHNFFLRVGTFSILEIGFIVLAYAAGQNPVPLNLPSNITLAEAKGAFTVIFILWHALAVFIAKDILLHIFSAEWMEQYRMSGNLVPGETDVVSRLTAGFLDQLKHFTLSKATLPFRLSFIGSVLLIFLNALGPSAISVSSIFLKYPLEIKVANLTMTSSVNLLEESGVIPLQSIDPNSRTRFPFDRTNLIVRMEHLENVNYSFQSEGNVLIPWPSLTPVPTDRTVWYESDVITYNFSCSWKQPMINGSMTLWAIDNRIWGLEGYPHPQFKSLDEAAAILPMMEVEPPDHSSFVADHNSLSAFLFVGANTTLRTTFDLDLEDIPANFIPIGSNSSLGKIVEPSLVSALVCDPHLHSAPATVTLSNGHLQATPRPGPPVVKNIPIEAASVIFTESLITPTSSFDVYEDGSIAVINSIARVIFLGDTSLEFSSGVSNNRGKPLPLDQINQNMNAVLLSSAKAYLSGYRPNGDPLSPPSFATINTNATAEAQRLALTGSRPFLIALLVVVCILIVLLGFLVTGIRGGNQLRTFDLENILKTLKIG